MEWKVTNAINRDVERQQLNRVLADIKNTLDKAQAAMVKSTSTTEDPRDIIGRMVEGNTEKGLTATYDSTKKVLNFVTASFNIALVGDVTGTGTVSSNGNVTIDTQAVGSISGGIPDAPIDENAYWRSGGQWDEVPGSLQAFSNLEGVGYPSLALSAEGEYLWQFRVFEAEAGQLVITSPAGDVANTKYGLAPIPDTGTGALLATTRDAYGRTEGSRAAVPADIPTYLHTQSVASTTWTINHNLGRRVAVSVFTVGGVGVLAEVVNVSTNQAQVLLDSPADGYAILN